MKIIYSNDEVTVCGSVPVKLKAYEDPDQHTEVSKIDFNIPGEITRQEICESRIN